MWLLSEPHTLDKPLDLCATGENMLIVFSMVV